jgi:hypothetical protein
MTLSRHLPLLKRASTERAKGAATPEEIFRQIPGTYGVSHECQTWMFVCKRYLCLTDTMDLCLPWKTAGRSGGTQSTPISLTPNRVNGRSQSTPQTDTNKLEHPI